MSTRILILFLASLGTLLFAESPQSEENGGAMTAKAGPTASRTRGHAEARITVQNSEAKAYDQTAGPALVEVQLNETFSGDREGESPVRALEVLRGDKSASLVSVQRFHGTLGGRQGSFVLQGQEVVEKGDQGKMVCRSRLGNRSSLRAAGRG